jgi:hypothetical protein
MDRRYPTRTTFMTAERAGRFMYVKGIRSLNELLRRYPIILHGRITETYPDLNAVKPVA